MIWSLECQLKNTMKQGNKKQLGEFEALGNCVRDCLETTAWQQNHKGSKRAWKEIDQSVVSPLEHHSIPMPSSLQPQMDQAIMTVVRLICIYEHPGQTPLLKPRMHLAAHHNVIGSARDDICILQ